MGRRRQRGFTPIERMIVEPIIGALASIGAPRFPAYIAPMEPQ